jgi:3-oxoadipate enol-lactonase
MWREQQQSLGAMGYRVIVLDLPGLSGIAEPDFSMTSAGDTIADAIQRNFRRSAHLVGISIGATLAVQVALDHPERIASLLLSGGQARPGLAGRLEWLAARATPERLLVGAFPSGIEKSYPDLAESSVEMQKRIGKRRLVAALEAFSRVDLRPRLGEIQAPTLVVCGTKTAFLEGLLRPIRRHPRRSIRPHQRRGPRVEPGSAGPIRRHRGCLHRILSVDAASPPRPRESVPAGSVTWP